MIGSVEDTFSEIKYTLYYYVAFVAMLYYYLYIKFSSFSQEFVRSDSVSK